MAVKVKDLTNKTFGRLKVIERLPITKTTKKPRSKWLCQCSCGNKGEWQDKKLTLDIDHINGNHRDHRLENLRFICPNCHSQTPSFRNKNGTGKMKVTDDEMINALRTTTSIRAALIKVGLSARGLNYQRAYKLLNKMVS